jgi:hypothetical protein
MTITKGIANMHPQTIVKTRIGRELPDIERWLVEQDLKILRDYHYLGRHHASDFFSFSDPKVAMLFKLTYGGE